MVNLQDIQLFIEGNQVLKDIDLQIAKGEFIYIIGKTGSGKSSLMKLLYADLPIQKGEAEIAGFNLNNLKQKDIPFLRRKIGIVFQDFKLLPDRSIYKNLEFVLKATGWLDAKQIDEKIKDVLNLVGMADYASKMPHQLSGGQQQSIAIARALLNDPEIILADEPTGNLDPQTGGEVMELLLKINATGKTILMVTHNYAIILKYPAKTLKIEDGQLFEVVQKNI